MAQIIESIPNISEGRNTDVIEACVDQIRTTAGCTLLNYSSDPNHNRTVITYIGNAQGVHEASVKLAKKAAELIDLTKHTGEHPRMGAVDVMPFVPIKDASIEDCVELSKVVGKEIAEEANIPVFLYEYSATRPERQNLATIRKGQFEGMAEKVKEPDWCPDFGGARIHPTAGVVAVGCRPPLVAYNINLETSDVNIAKEIATKIREKDGGYKNIKAMGFMLEDRNIAQVSMNMTNFNVTGLYTITEAVRKLAEEAGTKVIGTEMIGLCPMKALIDAAESYLAIENFDFDGQVLENYIL